MKWIKATERLPVGENYHTLNIKYKGSASVLVWYYGSWYWSDNSFSERFENKVDADSWSVIEWLDESESPNEEEGLAERYQELREVLQDFARQKTLKELTADEKANGDFYYAYDYLITNSRKALHSSGVGETKKYYCTLDEQQCQQDCEHKGNRAGCPFVKEKEEGK